MSSFYFSVILLSLHLFYFRAQCARKYYLVQTHANSFSFREESMEPVCKQTLSKEILHFQKKKADPAKSRADFLHFHAKLAFSAKSKIKTVHFQPKSLIPAQHFKQTSFP